MGTQLTQELQGKINLLSREQMKGRYIHSSLQRARRINTYCLLHIHNDLFCFIKPTHFLFFSMT